MLLVALDFIFALVDKIPSLNALDFRIFFAGCQLFQDARYGPHTDWSTFCEETIGDKTAWEGSSTLSRRL